MFESLEIFNNNNNNLAEEFTQEFIQTIMKSNHPHIIFIYDMSELGEGKKLNQIIQGINSDDYFNLKESSKTKLENNITQTKGCKIYGPIIYKDVIENNGLDINEFDANLLNDELFFLYVEGLKSICNVANSCVPGIFALLQIASIKILTISESNLEKIDELYEFKKLSDILNISKNENESLILIRDVPIRSDENINQMKEEISKKRLKYQEDFDKHFDKMNNKKPICKILPKYDSAKSDNKVYVGVYKEQMKSLIITVLSKIKNNNDTYGKKLIEIINELIDIFKHVDKFESIININNNINSILLKAFKQKLKKYYSTIKDKLEKYDKNIFSLANKKEIF